MTLLLCPTPGDAEGPLGYRMRVAEANLLSFRDVSEAPWHTVDDGDETTPIVKRCRVFSGGSIGRSTKGSRSPSLTGCAVLSKTLLPSTGRVPSDGATGACQKPYWPAWRGCQHPKRRPCSVSRRVA